jgi:hypothetical protein
MNYQLHAKFAANSFTEVMHIELCTSKLKKKIVLSSFITSFLSTSTSPPEPVVHPTTWDSSFRL